jgi:hypothetical protein
MENSIEIINGVTLTDVVCVVLAIMLLIKVGLELFKLKTK